MIGHWYKDEAKHILICESPVQTFLGSGLWGAASSGLKVE